MSQLQPGYVLNALLYSGLGLLLFLGVIRILSRMIPGGAWEQIAHQKNSAVAIAFGLLALSAAVIIAATLH
ncbi:MAG: DUF350 domain-containing protein [Acidobacteria bacterium]|nr:DUF350 domain-containing protein [Acidobacteriota bacterium]